tara:strand:- start:1406 stop:1603 length:198 start_codon:yes stop_codon:yes gene_type:complete
MQLTWQKTASSYGPYLAGFGACYSYRVYKTPHGHSVYRKTGKDWTCLASFHSITAAKAYIQKIES